MQDRRSLPKFFPNIIASLVAVLVFGGCIADEKVERFDMKPEPASTNQPPATSQPAATASPTNEGVVAALQEPVPKPTAATESIRIKAGLTNSLTDGDGNVWLPDQGFTGGQIASHPNAQIANTTTPEVYRSEHYNMTAFSRALANGQYMVKLYFCENYSGITGPGQRVFTFNVGGHDFKDFDVWTRAPGALRAYVETVNVEVTNGKLDITFTPQVEKPEINGIEIIPVP